MPYRLVRDILINIQSAKQLHQIELNSPQLCGDDAEIWHRFIKRDFPALQEKHRWVPKNGKKWYEIYMKYKRLHEEEVKRDEENLRNALMGLKSQKESKLSKVVNLKDLPPLPKDSRMIGKDGIINHRSGGGWKKADLSSMRWTSGSKTKLTDGKSVLIRARREAKEITQMGKLSKPTHKLSQIGRVTKAPAGMINQYRTAAQPAIKLRAPASGFRIHGPSLEEREAKLLALTSGSGSAGAGSKRDASTTFKDDEECNYISCTDDEDNVSVDELFDEEATPPPKSSARPVAQPRGRIHQTSSSPPPIAAAGSPPPRPFSRDSSDSPAPMSRPKPMMARKRAPVDCFNRKVKKPRRT